MESQPELYGAVLKSVSRSFYLTIRALPEALRRPVGLAYLLARASDTIADSAGARLEVRVELLRRFGEAIHGTGPLPDLTPLQPEVADPSERDLLGRVDSLITLLERTEPEDRADIQWVMDEILRGQTLDVQRFPIEEGEPVVRALATAAELEDYTYSVAGCVGEFWTRLCLRHLKDYAGVAVSELVRRGIAFGKGLQLVNILRDFPADLANGRCYLPADELEVPLAALRANPALAASVHQRWLVRAREQLHDGFCYLEAVRPWRLRLACFLPWAIGEKTLDLLEKKPLSHSERVKVPRKQVYRLLLWGLAASLGNFTLYCYAGRPGRSEI